MAVVIHDDHPLVGTTFVSPTGPNARFPEREMRVVRVFDNDGVLWVVSEPVRFYDSDRFFHCTYEFDFDGKPIPV